MAVQCPMCSDFFVSTLKLLLAHIYRVHAHRPNFQIACGISGCQATYKNFRRFKDHLNKKHPGQLQCRLQSSQVSLVHGASIGTQNEGDNSDENMGECMWVRVG